MSLIWSVLSLKMTLLFSDQFVGSSTIVFVSRGDKESQILDNLRGRPKKGLGSFSNNFELKIYKRAVRS